MISVYFPNMFIFVSFWGPILRPTHLHPHSLPFEPAERDKTPVYAIKHSGFDDRCNGECRARKFHLICRMF